MNKKIISIMTFACIFSCVQINANAAELNEISETN